MDVVNGKIVSARSERCRSDIWSALKPSRSSLLQEPGTGNRTVGPGGHSHSTGSFTALRGFREFYGSRFGGTGVGHGPQYSAEHSSFEPGWNSFEPGWKRCSSSSGDHHHRPNSFSCRSHIHHSITPATERVGRSVVTSTQVGSLSTTTGTQSGCKRLASASISNALFDEEMDSYESHVSRAVIGHLDRSVGKAVALLSSSSSTPPAAAPGSTNPFKRPRISEPQVDEPWTTPLRYLMSKVMSVSDVGELGRIVLPKKEAEGQLPQIDTKGKQLQMKDYSFSKSWFFHYKWWANNKSRMYVLENTENNLHPWPFIHLRSSRWKDPNGEFIKRHGLEPYDSFVVYEDGSGNLVARGQKKPTWISQMHSPVNRECSQSEKVVVSKPTAIVEAICCFNSSIPDDDHPSGNQISNASSSEVGGHWRAGIS